MATFRGLECLGHYGYFHKTNQGVGLEIPGGKGLLTVFESGVCVRCSLKWAGNPGAAWARQVLQYRSVALLTLAAHEDGALPPVKAPGDNLAAICHMEGKGTTPRGLSTRPKGR